MDLCGPVAPAQKNNTGLKYVSGKYGATNSGVFCLLAFVSLAPVILNYPSAKELAAEHKLAQSNHRGRVPPPPLLCFISTL